MLARIWLWLGTGLSILIFFYGAFLVYIASDVAATTNYSPAAVGALLLFLALPIIALAATWAAWRAHRKGKAVHASLLLMAPLVLAAFILSMLVFGAPFA